MSEQTIGATVWIFIKLGIVYAIVALIGGSLTGVVAGPGVHDLVGSAIAIYLFHTYINGTIVAAAVVAIISSSAMFLYCMRDDAEIDGKSRTAPAVNRRLHR